MASKRWVMGALHLGAVYRQHTQFVRTAVDADEAMHYELLQNYVDGLSDAAFTGFKITLSLAASSESNAPRKEIINSFVRNADGARTGRPEAAQLEVETNDAADDDFDAYVSRPTMLGDWYKLGDEERRMQALLDHLMTLDQQQYSSFEESLRNHKRGMRSAIADHKDRELEAWGSDYEAQTAYFQARMRHGAKDPEWQAVHDEFTSHLEFFDWTIRASEGAWEVIGAHKET